jgi:glycosyltransferase involved in cell wall biosynthesis
LFIFIGMINGKKVVVCLPAYNAAKTLERTYLEIPSDIVDEVVLVDDCSIDETVSLANRLGINHVIRHDVNKGYGGNQKTCYQKALSLSADVIIMLHPDYQYNPALIPSMAYLVANGIYPVVLGSRILGKGAVANGMPVYKYFFNRLLTFFQNILLTQKVSEYHTGYRAFSRQVIQSVNLAANSDNFVFDNQLLAQIFYKGFTVGEISCPARYFPEASSINFRRSVVYGLGVVYTSILYRLCKWRLYTAAIFK